MARSKTYKKNIVCFESFWNGDVENRLTVAPMLELVARRNGIKFVHFTCNTPEEFMENVGFIPKRKHYSILYLAFHGKPGQIVFGKGSIRLDALGEILEGRLNNWIIHFGCCRTLSCDERRVREFLSRTEALMVSGYRKDIDWLSGTVIDLLFLNQIQFYKEMRKFWKRFNDAPYPLEELGLEAYHK